MVGPWKTSDLGSPEGWKMLLWKHLFHVQYRNKGVIPIIYEVEYTIYIYRYKRNDNSST